MPISEYYGGKGSQVMSDMAQRYGEKKAPRVFYATLNKRKSEGRPIAKKRSPATTLRGLQGK